VTGRYGLYNSRSDQSPRTNVSSDSTGADSDTEPVGAQATRRKCTDSRYSKVVFHCSSSNGRGPRCAAWYEDALLERGLESNARILTGGIKAWMKAYPDEVVRI
jgi:rhodanese-related sulfurtransferase